MHPIPARPEARVEAVADEISGGLAEITLSKSFYSDNRTASKAEKGCLESFMRIIHIMYARTYRN